MCIIIVKEKGKEIPNNKILENCFERNPDGAGIMYNENNKVIIKKGFMNVKALENEIKNIKDIKNKGVVIHFRIGTSGTNSAENTHPYEITSKFWNYKKLENACNLGVAHNGIISKYTPRGKNKHNFNDTQLYIMKRLSRLPDNFYTDSKTLEKIGTETGSRFAFLDSKGNITTCGTGWVIDNDIKYSNTSYIDYSYKWNDWNDWDKWESSLYSNYGSYSNSYGWSFASYEELGEILDTMERVTHKRTIYMEDGTEIVPEFEELYFTDTEYQELYLLDIVNKSLDYIGNYEIIL